MTTQIRASLSTNEKEGAETSVFDDQLKLFLARALLRYVSDVNKDPKSYK